MRKRILNCAAEIMACLLLLPMLLAGCASVDTSKETPSAVRSASLPADSISITVEDYTGESIAVPSTNRIVSLAPAITSTLIELGCEERIVGVDSQSRGVADAADCGTAVSPDIDTIVSLAPDIVFVGLQTGDSALTELKEAGLAVVDAEAASFDQVPGSFTFIGEIVGDRAAAEALAGQLEATAAEVTAARPSASPVCLYVHSLTGDMIETSGPGSLVSTMIELAGGVPVTADAPGQWPEYTAQQAVQTDPDCIIYSSSAASYDELVESAFFRDLSAVAGGLVFAIDEQIISEPGPALNEGLLALSSIVNEAAEGPIETADAASEATDVTD